MAYTYDDEEEVRDGFWREHDYEPRGNGRQNAQSAEVRTTFKDRALTAPTLRRSLG